MRIRRGCLQAFCLLIGILPIFGFSLPTASQSADNTFAVDGEPLYEIVQVVDNLEPGEYTFSEGIYNTPGNLWEDGAQVEPPQPGLLWLYILLVAIIAICGLAIVLLLKSGPLYSRPDAPSHDEGSTQYESLPAEEEVDQTQTEMQEVGASYMAANALVGNGAFERDDRSTLFDEAVVNQPSSVSAYLIVDHTAGPEQTYHLFENTASIGRGKDVYIMLLDNKVSRYHAEISYKDGEYIFVDNQPSNPTHINDEIYSSPHVIRDNDEFIIGETRIVFKRVQ